MQLLQRSIPKIAAQLPFSLVACCRGGFFYPCTGRRANPGRFGSLTFVMKNRHFGGQCSCILAGKARKCGRFWVFACVSQILVNRAFCGESVLQVLGNKARKKCQIVPFLPMFGNGPNTVSESTVSNTELSEFFWGSLSSGERTQ